MTEPQWIAPGEHGFLAGETLYMRPLELADARYPAAWHFSPFPINPERAEEILKQDLPKEANERKYRLVACRRSDDIPVGAVSYGNLWSTLNMWAELHVDPAHDADAAAIKSEMLRLVVPWMSAESHNMVVAIKLDAPEPDLIAAVKALGLRPAVCFREARWQGGGRHDQWFYELLHPAWVERLGDPGPSINLATDPPETSPGSRRVSIKRPAGPLPKNLILASERVALRPAEADDWKEGSRLLRRETETFYDRGRWLPSPVVGGHWVTEAMKADPPSWIPLTVILRETGQVIGHVGLHGISLFHRTAETGSMIFLPELRGQGLGSEAKNLLLEYAFDHLGFHMLRSFVWGPNTRSQAALRKQGYRPAGGFRWESTQGGTFVDSMAFDLLASEWQARVSRES
ncbi:MAG: GNAT family N-acetyltransferase [Chloroflexota bacterium]|nr:GNAT family N-acetyltransferase [Chloroflexota bacterium]